MTGAVAEVDFLARLAAGWDGTGADVIMANERRALWMMARLPAWPAEQLAPRWRDLEPAQREALVRAARQAIELGRWAMRCFGE